MKPPTPPEPSRWVEQAHGAFEISLLRAAREEQPDEEAVRRMLAGVTGLGLVAGSLQVAAGAAGLGQGLEGAVSAGVTGVAGSTAPKWGPVAGGPVAGGAVAGGAVTGGAGKWVALKWGAIKWGAIKWGVLSTFAGLGLTGGLALLEKSGGPQSAEEARPTAPRAERAGPPSGVPAAGVPAAAVQAAPVQRPSGPDAASLFPVGSSFPAASAIAGVESGVSGPGREPALLTERGASAERLAAPPSSGGGREVETPSGRVLLQGAEKSRAEDSSSESVALAPTSGPVSAELKLLERAREALAAERPQRALSLLARYEREFPAGMLRQEATVLRVEALSARGEKDAAGSLGERFLSQHPDSAHRARVERSQGQ